MWPRFLFMGPAITRNCPTKKQHMRYYRVVY